MLPALRRRAGRVWIFRGEFFARPTAEEIAWVRDLLTSGNVGGLGLSAHVSPIRANAEVRRGQAPITCYTTADFLATLADHVPDRYRHNIRYFGLLAPRTKARTHDTVFALLGQERRGKPWRLSWAASIRKSFGVDPLLDGQGDRMRWCARLRSRKS